MRYFSNIYSTWKFGKASEVYPQCGSRHSTYFEVDKYLWNVMGFAAVGRIGLGDKWKIGGRAELYYDPEHVIVGGPSFYEFMASGASINADLQIHNGVYLRWEARWLNYTTLKLGINELIPYQRNNFFFLGSLAMDLNKVLK
jgi:hypothetical protein